MKNLAKTVVPLNAKHDQAFQTMGTIVRIEGSTFIVQTDEGDVRATRAVSCLVEPMQHDFVLVGAMQRAAYVLAILERESTTVDLATPGDMNLKVGETFRVIAQQGVDLVTPESVSITSKEVGVHTSRAKVFAGEILAIGSEVIGELTNVKLKGTFFDKVYERVSERVQRSFRRVEEIDQLKAKQIDYVADETMCLRSDNMVATAKELVKVDGEQIHFG